MAEGEGRENWTDAEGGAAGGRILAGSAALKYVYVLPACFLNTASWTSAAKSEIQPDRTGLLTSSRGSPTDLTTARWEDTRKTL